MNFIVSGDWHIRVRPEIPEEWQVLRYNRLAAEIIDLCSKHEARLFLSGDTLDRNRPSLIELQLFIEILVCISDAGIDTWLIAGNHESIGRGQSTFDYLHDVFDSINTRGRGQIHFAHSDAWLYLPVNDEGVDFTFVGHPGLTVEPPKGLMETIPFKRPHVLITHVRPTVNQFIREEIDVEKLIEPFDYCFASDIHEALELYGGKLVFTNKPLNSSFEAKPDCGCLLLSVNDGQVSWERIPLDLPNLIQITTTAESYQPPPEDKHYYRVEIKGSSADLREITLQQPNVKLLKVPEIAETYAEAEDAEEIRDSSLEEALIEYMQFLQFAEPKIQDMMEVYREP